MEPTFTQWLTEIYRNPVVNVAITNPDSGFVKELLPGLLGALVGGGLSLFGVWLTNRQQWRSAARERSAAWLAHASRKQEEDLERAVQCLNELNEVVLKLGAMVALGSTPAALTDEMRKISGLQDEITLYIMLKLPSLGSRFCALIEALRRVTDTIPDEDAMMNAYRSTELADKVSMALTANNKLKTALVRCKDPFHRQEGYLLPQPTTVEVDAFNVEVEKLSARLGASG